MTYPIFGAYPLVAQESISMNIEAMAWNIFLALIPLIAAYVLAKRRTHFLAYLLIPLWFAFVPNTLYMITDVVHLVMQYGRISWQVDVFLFCWYSLVISFGIASYLLSMGLMHQYLRRRVRLHEGTIQLLADIMNILIGIAIGMGRFARTNSWHIVSDPLRVVRDLVVSLQEPFIILFISLYALGGILLYRIYRTRLIHTL